MGIGTIEIFKMTEFNGNGHYRISTNDFRSPEFYMIIDKENRIIRFYLTQNFILDPVKIIDCKIDAPIGEIPGVPTMVFSRAILQAVKTFSLDIFPDSLSYAA